MTAIGAQNCRSSGEGLRDGQDTKPDREQDGAGSEHGAATAMLNRAPDPWRNDACHQQPEGHSADHPCEGPAGIIGDWMREDCQEIIGRSPGQDLPDAEYRDEPAEALGPPYDRPFDVRIHRGPTYRTNG
jgi:hypothetical protein